MRLYLTTSENLPVSVEIPQISENVCCILGKFGHIKEKTETHLQLFVKVF